MIKEESKLPAEEQEGGEAGYEQRGFASDLCFKRGFLEDGAWNYHEKNKEEGRKASLLARPESQLAVFYPDLCSWWGG